MTWSLVISYYFNFRILFYKKKMNFTALHMIKHNVNYHWTAYAFNK